MVVGAAGVCRTLAPAGPVGCFPGGPSRGLPTAACQDSQVNAHTCTDAAEMQQMQTAGPNTGTNATDVQRVATGTNAAQAPMQWMCTPAPGPSDIGSSMLS